MQKIVLTFGLIAGAVLSAMMFLTLPFMDHGNQGLLIGYTTMVLAFLMVYFGVRSYRDNVAGGLVTFGRAFKVGALISLVASTCYVASWEVIYFKMRPDFMEKYAASAIAAARKDGATEAEIAQKTQEMAKFAEQYKNPLINIAYTYLEPLPVALLFTLITAGVLSRKRRDATA